MASVALSAIAGLRPEQSPRRREGPERPRRLGGRRLSQAAPPEQSGWALGEGERGPRLPHGCCVPGRDGGPGLARAAGAVGRRKSMRVQMRCHFIDDASGHFVQRWLQNAISHTRGGRSWISEHAFVFTHPLPGRGGGGQLRCRRGLGWPSCWIPKSAVIVMSGDRGEREPELGLGLVMSVAGHAAGLEGLGGGRTGRRSLGWRGVRRQSPQKAEPQKQCCGQNGAAERETVCFPMMGKPQLIGLWGPSGPGRDGNSGKR